MLKVLEDSRIQIRDTSTQRQETVLVMQGGGSLGAYECGVYKTLERYGIKFDIIAGTSIGAINAAIIVGSNSEPSAKNLEQFWFTLAENVTPSFLSDNIRPIFSSIFASLYGNRMRLNQFGIHLLHYLITIQFFIIIQIIFLIYLTLPH